MGLSVLISAWLVGVLGAVHCLAMCGGFLAAVVARDGARAVAPLLPLRTIARRQLAYHAGRVATYALLGAAFGAAGAAALKSADLLSLQRALYVAANIFLVLLALSLATGAPGVAWLQRAGARVFGIVLPAIRPLLQQPGAIGRIALGLIWGLVPCALVYSVLPLALFAGGTWEGAAVMLAFGLGTVPNLIGTGVLLGHARPLVERKSLRYVAAAVLIAFAFVGLYRVMFVPDALAQGPYCLSIGR